MATDPYGGWLAVKHRAALIRCQFPVECQSLHNPGLSEVAKPFRDNPRRSTWLVLIGLLMETLSVADTGRNVIRHVDLAGAPPSAANSPRSPAMVGRPPASSCRFCRPHVITASSWSTSCSRVTGVDGRLYDDPRPRCSACRCTETPGAGLNRPPWHPVNRSLAALVAFTAHSHTDRNSTPPHTAPIQSSRHASIQR